MPSDDLNNAIQLIQQGQPEQAQPILQGLIRTNPQDVMAWSWYVKSSRTAEQRLQLLELCLRFNPGNPQILEAIQKLREKLFAQQPPAFSGDSEPVSLALNPEPYSRADALAVLEMVSEVKTASEPAEFVGLDESPGRPFMWYDVWLKALTQANVETYTALIRDPLASPGRAYWWMFLAAIVTGLVSLANPTLLQVLNILEQQQGAEKFSAMIAVALVVFVPVGATFSVLGLMLGAAIYHALAKSFGGSGNFSRTVYLMGAYAAPLSIVMGILAIIPFVSCLNLLLSFYQFKLGITSVQVAQRLNGGRATIVVMIPGLLLFMVFCIAMAVGGQAFLEFLRTLPQNN